MLQFLLKLQHTISLRDNKIGMNMKEVIVLITHVMDVIGEVVRIATEEVCITYLHLKYCIQRNMYLTVNSRTVFHVLLNHMNNPS